MTIEYKDSKRIVASGIGTELSGVGGWKELGRITAGGSSTTMDITGLADKRYLQFIVYSNLTSSNTINNTLNGITTNTYAERHSIDGGSDVTTVSTANLNASLGFSATPKFEVGYIANLDTKEKLALWWEAIQNTAGSGTAPRRIEFVSKHVQTTNPIDQFTTTSGSGNFPSGSEVVVLGYDPDDTHTDNFWEELASVDLSGGNAGLIDSGTFTAKKYLWIQLYVSTTGGGVSQRLTFNSDTGSNYAQRKSFDGGQEYTSTNSVNIDGMNDDLVTNSGGFTNIFIVNNSANEKLGIGHTISQEAAGAGNTPTRDQEVFKWVNTSSQITKLTFTNNKSGNMDTSTTLKVWGSN